jgi:hypothetical protein
MSQYRNLMMLSKDTPYFCEVEYVQSDGNCYLDLGYVSKPKDRVEQMFALNDTDVSTTKSWFGSISVGGDNNPRFSIGAYNQGIFVGYNLTCVVSGTITTAKYVIQMRHNGSNYQGKIGNTSWCNYSPTREVEPSVNSYLFARNEGNGNRTTDGTGTKIYYHKQWNEQGVLIADIIPVLDKNMTPCMFNKVNGEFLYNQGTGTFTVGRQIHYVEWVGSNGLQWFDALVDGFTIDSTVRIETANRYNEVSSKAEQVEGDSTRPFYFGINNYGRYRIGNESDVYASTTSFDTIVFTVNNRIATLNVNGEDILTNNEATAPSGQLYVFTAATAGNLTTFSPCVDKKYCKIWINGELQRDFYPAIDETGKAFMFDKVNHCIFDNEGTGEFQFGLKKEDAQSIASIRHRNGGAISRIKINTQTDKVESLHYATSAAKMFVWGTTQGNNISGYQNSYVSYNGVEVQDPNWSAGNDYYCLFEDKKFYVNHLLANDYSSEPHISFPYAVGLGRRTSSEINLVSSYALWATHGGARQLRNGEVIHHYKPAKNKVGKLGYYDTVSGHFAPLVGDGTEDTRIIVYPGENLFDADKLVSEAGFSKNGAEYYRAISSGVVGKIVWTNTDNITDRLKFDIEVKYSDASSRGVFFEVNYTDGTKQTFPDAQGNTSWNQRTFVSNPIKVVSTITLSYGTGSVETTFRHMILLKVN